VVYGMTDANQAERRGYASRPMSMDTRFKMEAGGGQSTLGSRDRQGMSADHVSSVKRWKTSLTYLRDTPPLWDSSINIV